MATATTEVESPLKHLSPEQLEAIAREFEEIGERVRADLGERDRRYIERVIETQRLLAVLSRALLAADSWPARVAGTAALSAAKILENMEIGHNVLHGQWDWMNDPRINSATWDWDTASTAEVWKRTHNYHHHTFVNIRGKDKDLGYDLMRIDPEQKWYPTYLLQPLYNLLLMALFEWGIAIHDLDREEIMYKRKPKSELKREVASILEKAKNQIVKDYIAWPLMSGLVAVSVELALGAGSAVRPGGGRRGGRGGTLRRALERGTRAYRATAKANATANVVRNAWTYALIFCGHFPDQVYIFSEEEVEDETPGGWYVRQLAGTANIEGSPLFHVISGNLGHQVEHHLFPDVPSNRYAELAPRVRDVCERYGLPYNTGPFLRQFGMVQRTILRLAFPGGKPRPNAVPYRSELSGAP